VATKAKKPAARVGSVAKDEGHAAGGEATGKAATGEAVTGYCLACGEELIKNARFCPNCGEAQGG